MSSLVDTLPNVQLSTVVPSQKLLSEIDVIIDDSRVLIDQLPDPNRGLSIIHNTVRHGNITVLWLGQTRSPLGAALIQHLISIDINLILLSREEQLWHWLNANSSVKVASLIIETNINTQTILSRSHTHKNVRSILVRCQTTELIRLQRFARSHIKIDGVYADDTRVLIRLVIDLALASEELGDEEREDKNNEPEAQRHYDRALKLCDLAKKL